MSCSVSQCVAVCRSVLQRVAVHFGVPHWREIFMDLLNVNEICMFVQMQPYVHKYMDLSICIYVAYIQVICIHIHIYLYVCVANFVDLYQS